MTLKHSYALVTDGAQRLGRAIALELAQQGWNIALHFRASGSDSEQTLADIQALGVQAMGVEADLSKPEQVEQLFHTCTRSGPVRCVVNHESLILAKLLHGHVPEGQQGVVVNVMGQQENGRDTDFISYSSSKATLQTTTATLAMELAPKVRVVGVAFGFGLSSKFQTTEPLGHEADYIAAHDFAAEDIAQSVAFLVNSPAITGTTLLVDGGQHPVPTARGFGMINP